MKKVLLLSAFLTGFSAIALEVLRTRVMVMVIGGSTVFLALRLFVEGNPHKKKRVQKQPQHNQKSPVRLFNEILQIINSHLSKISSIFIEDSIHNITPITSSVNNNGSLNANTIKNNPAAIFTKNAEITRNLGFVTNLSIENIIQLTRSYFKT